PSRWWIPKWTSPGSLGLSFPPGGSCRFGNPCPIVPAGTEGPRSACAVLGPAAGLTGLAEAFEQAGPSLRGESGRREGLLECCHRVCAPAARQLDAPQGVPGEGALGALHGGGSRG